MLITYKKTKENYSPQVDDECEVCLSGRFFWVKIVRIFEDGYIRTKDVTGRRVDFPTTQELFDAIGDV